MKRAFFCAALFCLAGTLVFGQETAKGYIYEDLNGNGRRDRGEPGVTAAEVSNGSDLVRTDADGYYELPVRAGNTIFVIKPSGYQFPLDADHMPHFYYTHKPAGSPENYKFKGVAPTGKLPRPLNFALAATPEPDRFTALIFGDPQVRNRTMLGFYESKIVSELVGVQGISFGVSMGDVSDEDLDLMGPIKQATARIGVPWYYVNGNHDTNYDAGEDILSNETFIRYFGPPDYAFNYGQAHLLVIDDIYFPDPHNPTEKRWAAQSGLREDQRQFIRNDLSFVPADHLVVLMMHVSLAILQRQAPQDAAFLMQQLAKFDRALVIASHNHTQSHTFYDKQKGWSGAGLLHEFVVGTTCGSWYAGFPDEKGNPEAMMLDGTPQGYAYLQVDGNRYTLDYKAAGQPASYQMSVVNPKVVMQNLHTPSFITVNFFMGHQDDTVEFRIDDGPWEAMQHTVMADPTYQRMYYRWEDLDEPHTTRWPSEVQLSTHIWRVLIPAKIPTGVHRIDVRATDQFGRTFYGQSSYRVEEAIFPEYP